MSISAPLVEEFSALLRGESTRAADGSLRNHRWLVHLVMLISGVGVFGAALGAWNSLHQALFAAIKLPLVVLLTTLGNALLNGMLAPLLGMRIGFRQSFGLVLTSFTVMAIILAALSPLLGFLIWNLPPMQAGYRDTVACELLLVTGVVGIAFAGIIGVLRLFAGLSRFTSQRIVPCGSCWRG
jgi:hypothetical protein